MFRNDKFAHLGNSAPSSLAYILPSKHIADNVIRTGSLSLSVACFALVTCFPAYADKLIPYPSTQRGFYVGYEIADDGSGFCQANATYKSGILLTFAAKLDYDSSRHWLIGFTKDGWKLNPSGTYNAVLVIDNSARYDLAGSAGKNGKAVYVWTNKDVMNAVAGGNIMTVMSNGKVVAQFELNDTAAAIRDLVHCTNDHPATKVAQGGPAGGGGGERNPQGANETSSGTGFFVAQGTIFTNYHVVNDCAGLYVKMPPYRPERAYILGSDETNDLAVLSTNWKDHSLVTFRTNPKLGEPVYLYGFPMSGILAAEGNFTLGNVTATTGFKGDTNYFQMSAPMQPGSSGSAVMDVSGNVLGSATKTMSTVKGTELIGGVLPQSINFAIQSSTIMNFLTLKEIKIPPIVYDKKIGPEELAAMAKKWTVQVMCGPVETSNR